MSQKGEDSEKVAKNIWRDDKSFQEAMKHIHLQRKKMERTYLGQTQ